MFRDWWPSIACTIESKREHLLRSLYELSEPQLPALMAIPVAAIHQDRHWNSLESQLAHALEAGEITRGDDSVQLTPLGLRRAARHTKTHRLWELFLVRHAGIAADHVDRDADDVEHLLPEALLVELEQQLASEGRLPEVVEQVPLSPHELGPDNAGRGGAT